MIILLRKIPQNLVMCLYKLEREKKKKDRYFRKKTTTFNFFKTSVSKLKNVSLITNKSFNLV